MQWNNIKIRATKRPVGHLGLSFYVAVVAAFSITSAAAQQSGRAQRSAPYGPSQALPADLDRDGDGWADETEQALGSDPGNPASTPESQAVPGSCVDGADNDLDGAADLNDLDPEPACGVVDLTDQIVNRRFPGRGVDAFPSRVEITDLAALLRESDMEQCRQAGERIPAGVSLSATGPTVIARGDPQSSGPEAGNAVGVSIAALQAAGQLRMPGLPVIPFVIVKKPKQPSPGQVRALQQELDFPAMASFDVGVDIHLQIPEGLRGNGDFNIPPYIPCIRKRMENPSVISLPPVEDKNDCYQGPFARHCVQGPTDVPLKQPKDKPGEIKPKYVYSVKFLCGKVTNVSDQKEPPPFEPGDLFGVRGEPPVKPGNYATAINIHNPYPKSVIIAKKAVEAPREPKKGKPSRFVTMRLGPDQATEVDCPDIAEQLRLPPDTRFAKGFEVIESPIRIDVVAVYTQEVAKERVLDKITCRLRKKGNWPDPFVAIVQPPAGVVPDLSPGSVGMAYDPKPFCLEALRKAGFSVDAGVRVEILNIQLGVGKGVGSSIDVEYIEPRVIDELPPIQIREHHQKEK